MLARRRTASGVRLSNFAIASTLFALRISSRNLFSSSGVHGAVGIAIISPSPSARSRPGGEHSVILLLQNDPDDEDQNYDDTDLNP
jgi:hypothetical protein